MIPDNIPGRTVYTLLLLATLLVTPCHLTRAAPAAASANDYRQWGLAAEQRGDYSQAVADLERAVEQGLHYHYRGMTLLRIGDIYRDQLDAPDKALAAYRAVGAERCKGEHHVAAVADAAGILLQQGDVDAALHELDQVDPRQAARSSRAHAYLTMRGRVLAAADRRQDAVDAWREALRLDNLDPATRADIEQNIERLLRSGQQLLLAAEGRTDYQVLLPADTADPRVDRLLRAGAELIRDAFAANGFTLTVTNETTRHPEQPGIFVGNTRFAQRNGVDVTAIEGWGYVHRVIGRDLIITGNDKPHPLETVGHSRPKATGARVGTLKGIADFLHTYARTRFVYPYGNTGVEFLETPVIAVPADLDETFTPKLDFFFSNWIGSRGAIDPPWCTYFVANNYYPTIDGLGDPHSYPYAVPADKFAKTNPEYFALINGERTASDDLCISNTNVQELLYGHLLAHLDQGYDVGTLGQQDGFRACQCEPCHALFGTGDDWGEKLWILHRGMAERLLHDRPDKTVILIVYGETWTPPKAFNEFPPNVLLRMRSPSEERRAAWRDVEVPGGYFAGLGNFYGSYLPRETPQTMTRFMRELHEFGFRGLFLDCALHNFGLQGPTYYVMGRLWQDPTNMNPVELLEEYYAAAFGRAALPMERFYDALHNTLNLYHEAPRTTIDIYGMERARFPGGTVQLMTSLYPPHVIDDMARFLSRAEALATADKVKARLRMVRLEFDYLHRLATMCHLHNAYRMAPADATYGALLDAVDEANVFIDRITSPEVLGRPIPAWPEARFLMAHGRHLITRGFQNTPLTWDTEERRNAPREQQKDDDALTRKRMEIYEATFELPEEWAKLTPRLNLSGNWKFSPDVADRGIPRGWPNENHDDAGWISIPVPAFWDETPVGTHTGYAWYRKTFQVPADWDGQPIQLGFGGIDEQAWIYFNSRLVREHTVASEGAAWDQLWDRPFTITLQPHQVRYGKANTIAVRVYNEAGAGGIWRPVVVTGVGTP